jgi:hypothetical protein
MGENEFIGSAEKKAASIENIISPASKADGPIGFVTVFRGWLIHSNVIVLCSRRRKAILISERNSCRSVVWMQIRRPTFEWNASPCGPG